MSDLKKIIEMRLEQAFRPVFLNVIDDSNKHIGHAAHTKGGQHFSIVITAEDFKGLARVAAHRKIYALFTDLMPDKIHALAIQIKD